MLQENKAHKIFRKTSIFYSWYVLADIDVNGDDEEYNGMRFHRVSQNYEGVRDHCHFTAKYRKTAHSNCNLR